VELGVPMGDRVKLLRVIKLLRGMAVESDEENPRDSLDYAEDAGVEKKRVLFSADKHVKLIPKNGESDGSSISEEDSEPESDQEAGKTKSNAVKGGSLKGKGRTTAQIEVRLRARIRRPLRLRLRLRLRIGCPVSV